MKPRSFASGSCLVLLFAGCGSTANAPSPEVQTIVEATAKKYPDVMRLTVHRVPAGGSDYVAVASTAADKLGRKSDPEDLRAMESGEIVVLDENGATDVTVPVLEQGGKYTAAVGVTWKPGTKAEAGSLENRSREIAYEIARVMPK